MKYMSAEQLTTLRQLNSGLSRWAASLSWWRMIALALILMIATAWISSALNLKHHRSVEVKVNQSASVKKSKSSETTELGPCVGDEVRIGGKNGIVVCDRGRAPTPLPPVVPTPPTSGPVAATSDAAPATPATKRQQPVASNPDDDDDEDEPIRKTVNVTRTLGGWIGDLLSALLIAFFAYLVASKVIVRHSAEADARVRVATDSAEREAMERQLVQARLKLLQAQVEPHFLFNTLAAVDYLIETDPSRASVMQKTLIAYLRAALPQMRQDSSTLGQEVTLVRHYLELLKLRIEDRLRFEISMPTGLASAIFPPLVLQTLVENAIKHGIEPKPEGGLVRVQAEVSDGQLCVEVIDTGVGLPQGGVRGPSGNGNGLGLDNIRARLEMLYPKRSRLELSSGAAGETRAHVSIPYQTDSTKSKT